VTLKTLGGKFLVNAAGKILSGICACLCSKPPVVPSCCDTGTLPATATYTLTVNALTPITGSMSKVGSGYFNDVTLLCDLGDGHRQIMIDMSIVCFSNNWSFLVSYSVVTDGVLGNFTQWSHSYPALTNPAAFSLSCSPFHMHFAGGHTIGVDGDGPTLACGGRTYPFDATPGTINAVIDIVTP